MKARQGQLERLTGLKWRGKADRGHIRRLQPLRWEFSDHRKLHVQVTVLHPTNKCSYHKYQMNLKGIGLIECLALLSIRICVSMVLDFRVSES